MTSTQLHWILTRPRSRASAAALTIALALLALLGFAGAARAATGGYPYSSMPCEHAPYAVSGRANYCADYDWGPKHTARYDDPSEISPYGYAYRNCTDFVAWKLATLGVPASLYRGHGNAKAWASVGGVVTNTTPAIGAVAVQTGGTFGHVAFITAVNGNKITIEEYNYGENGTYDPRSGTLTGLGFNRVTHFEAYEHGAAPAPATPVPSIPDPPTSPPPTTSGPAPTNPTPTITTPPPTYAETTGGVANTWSDYQDAGGAGGPQIGSNQTVQIACWVSGFTVADGNTYWYQIASSPWNGQYYVSADAFYNNGATSGSLAGTPFVDPAVRACSGGGAVGAGSKPMYAETTGGVSHTWSDYQDAGGAEGPEIGSNQTVEIACWVSGFTVADGDTYWYQIASSPWNGQYYVSADAFYNNGATSGSLRGTPFVDPAVQHC
jgi:surface antigen